MTEPIEGRQSVYAALRARRRRIEVVLVAHGSHLEKLSDVLSAAEEIGVPVKIVDRSQLDSMAHGSSHGGVMALATPVPRLNGDQLLDLVARATTPPLLLLLEGVDDAQNLGFTLRSADAFGFDAVLIKKHLWDFDSIEVGRPASGAYERIPMVQIETVDPILRLQRLGVTVTGCIANVKTAIDECDLRRPTLLCVGGEKRGLSGAVREICDGFATIPTRGEPSSLSLSHAAAIVMGEAARQRRTGSN